MTLIETNIFEVMDLALRFLIAVAFWWLLLYLWFKDKRDSQQEVEEEEETNLLKEIIKQLPDRLEIIQGKFNSLTESISTSYELKKAKEELLAEIRKIEKLLEDMRLDIFGLPSRVGVQVNTLLEEEREQKQREEEVRRTAEQSARQEQQQKRDGKRRERIEENKKRQEEMRQNLIARINDLSKQSDLFRISLLTNAIIKSLRDASQPTEEFEEKLSPYLHTASRVQALRRKLDNRDTASLISLEDNKNGLEGEVKSLEEDSNSLDKVPRASWFINLIQAANSHPDLKLTAIELKEILGLEEFTVAEGEEMPDDVDLEVLSTEGLGKTTIISKVIETGYRLKDKGKVLRKPKVKICLRN
jgi:hypothetical protein